jgi:hypothetical protein
MVILQMDGQGHWDRVLEAIGPFQTISAVMDHVFGQATVLRGYAEQILPATNIPFTLNDKVYVISDLNQPYTEQVQNVNRPTAKGRK